MFKRNWLIIPLLIIGFYYNFWVIQNADKEMVFQEFVYGGLILIFLILLGISLRKDILKYKEAKNWKSFFPTIIGMTILLSFLASSLMLKIRDNSPVIIQAGYDGGFNGAWFDFRKDGTYKFANSGGIGADFFRGKYTLSDTIITLDKTEIDNVIKTNKLAIREIKNFDSTKIKVIYQIGENHNIIDKNFCFIVNKYQINE
ncbi:hypothetical protein EIB75_09955 [Epilithonimonas vandammei]|uniref:Uncharacterized protein n=1 Tax=Epilithonimonas vandammei TaxID=2487072 RepID=A0A3G8ZP04_9FLAO|nr:hypothetical protein [Epilithonimonas vandammei]AZI55551.1 hypothetical protein EIB75_09955 [Epilithonimonas vandammei]